MLKFHDGIKAPKNRNDGKWNAIESEFYGE